jgi:photosystem II stability/assembly factor-like uncharacterized protein
MGLNRRLVRSAARAALFCVTCAVWFDGGAQAATADQQAGASHDPTLLNTLSWRSLGPVFAGRSLAVAGSLVRPFEYYSGALGGGLWKTTDGGTTWAPIAEQQVGSLSVGAVAVAESDSNVVYIGTGYATLSADLVHGDGVYKSIDGGESWAHVGLAETQAVSRIVVHPSDPEVVYVAACGYLARPSEERGVFRSRDGGMTWQRVLFRDTRSGAVDLAMDRNNPQVIYAALWEAHRTPWQVSSGGPGSGLFKSADGGDTWRELTRNRGLPRGPFGRIGVAVSPADSNRVYAILEHGQGGLFRSDDGGGRWRRVSDDQRLRHRAFDHSRLLADPVSADTLYVLNAELYRSANGGANYEAIDLPHGDTRDLWIDARNPARMITGAGGGAAVTADGGRTWTSQKHVAAQLHRIAATADVPYHVCGTQQDHSTLCVPSRPVRGGSSASYSVAGGESGTIVPDPAAPDVFYAVSEDGSLTRFDRRQIGGEASAKRSGDGPGARGERRRRSSPAVLSPHDRRVLYTGSQHLWRTADEGRTWARLSPDLTRADAKTLGGPSRGPGDVGRNAAGTYATISAIAPSRLERDVIWTGSDDGLVHVTRDAGKEWANVTPHDMPEFARIASIAPSAHSPGTAYLAATRREFDDRTPYIYRTRDYGRTWASAAQGIGATDYVEAVREDPRRPGLLYAATGRGVWVSFTEGEVWQSISLNLPNTPVSDLMIAGNDLVIATYGRGIYLLDAAAPLRQLTPAVATADAYLFQPSDCTRSIDRATIYYLLNRSAEALAIEILDGQGNVIRSFARRSAGEQTGSAVPPAAGGLNRFVWDLRHPGPVPLSAAGSPGIDAAEGPVAVPGSYWVRLTVHGEVLTSSFRVTMHPGETRVTEADLQAQFDLAMRIRDLTGETNSAVLRIREIRSQVEDRRQNTRAPQVTVAASVLEKKLASIEEALYQTEASEEPRAAASIATLAERLSSLRRTVETVDARPTEAAYAVLEGLSSELERQRELLRQVIEDDVPRFNSVLIRYRREPIKAGGISESPAVPAARAAARAEAPPF